MKRIGLFALILSVVLALAACGGSGGSGGGTGGGGGGGGGGGLVTPTTFALHVHHTLVGAPAVDVIIDGVRRVTNLANGAATTAYVPQIPIGTGTSTIRFVETGTNTLVREETFSFLPQKAYTMYLTGRPQREQTQAGVDDVSDRPGELAHFRVAHMVEGAPDVDVYVVPEGASFATFQPLFRGVSFRNVESFRGIESQRLNIVVTVAGDPTQELARVATAGYSRDALFTIDVFENAVGAVRAVVRRTFDHGNGSVGTGSTGGGTGTSRIRAYHGVPGGPTVDVFVNGVKRVENVEYGQISPYLPDVPAGRVDVEYRTLSGDLVSRVVLNSNGGQSQTVWLVGNGGSEPIRPVVTADDLRVLNSSTSRTRILNAHPSFGSVDAFLRASLGDPIGSPLFADNDFGVVSQYRDTVVTDPFVTFRSVGSGSNIVSGEVTAITDDETLVTVILRPDAAGSPTVQFVIDADFD